MNVKKILLVSMFLLAILTIGAVSASDNTTSDDVALVSGETEDLEVSVETDDVLSDGFYYDNDFYVSIQENYTQDKSNLNAGELISIHSYCNQSGNFTVSVDNVEKLTIPLTDGYFEQVYDEEYGIVDVHSKSIYPNNLSLDYGTYKVKVDFNEKTLIESSVTISQRDDFEIWMQNPYYGEKEYFTSPSFMIIDSYNLCNGTLEIYVNGTRKLTYTLENGFFEGIPYTSNKSRCVSASDLGLDYGKYNIQIKFMQNGHAKTLRDENVTIAEFEPTTNPRLDLYFDFYTLIIPADNVARIYLPREATGNLTISYNDVIKNATVDYSKGYGEYYMNSWELNHLGENIITVTYVGDDFGTLTATGTVVVLPDVTSPSYVYVDEQFMISILTYDWVSGKLEIYDYTGDVKGDLLGSDLIFKRSGNQFATAYVKLSSGKSGLNKFYLDYFDLVAGHYSIIQEVYVIKNSQKVNVSIPSEVESRSEFDVVVYGPKDDFTFAQISVDDGDVSFVMLENGVARKTIGNLTDGYHTIRVFYENRNFVDVDEVYLNTFTVNVGSKTNISVSDMILDYNSTGKLTITLKDGNGAVLAGGEIKVSLNGEIFNLTTDNKGQASVDLIGLSGGNHTALIRFEGAEGYLSSNATSEITVNKLKTKMMGFNQTGYHTSITIGALLYDDAGNFLKDKEIRINFDGKNYTRSTDEKGIASVAITDFWGGNYTAYISFDGDENYTSSSAIVNISAPIIKRESRFNSVSAVFAPGYPITYQFVLGDVNLNPLSSKLVVVNIADMTLSNHTNDKGEVIFIFDLDCGNYSGNVSFAGDDYYLGISSPISVEYPIYDTNLTSNDVDFTVGNSGNLIIRLTDVLKNNMSGKSIIIRLNGESYNITTNATGQVCLPIDLPAGEYTADISYSGDKYYRSSSATSRIVVNKVNTKFTTPSSVTKTYNVNKKFIITLTDANGNAISKTKVTVVINGKKTTPTTDANGKITLTISNLAPKTYDAMITYAGDGTYKQSSAKVKIVVKKATPKITAKAKTFKAKTKTKKYTVTLKTNNGKVMKKVKLTLKVKGRTYKATTNSKGKATFKITKLSKKGKFSATVTFAGNKYYDKVVKKNIKITVKK